MKDTYDKHLAELKKKHPGLTLIGADGSPRGVRDKPMKMTIPDALKQLQSIAHVLNVTYPIKKFTLDGRLVGYKRTMQKCQRY